MHYLVMTFLSPEIRNFPVSRVTQASVNKIPVCQNKRKDNPVPEVFRIKDPGEHKIPHRAQHHDDITGGRKEEAVPEDLHEWLGRGMGSPMRSDICANSELLFHQLAVFPINLLNHCFHIPTVHDNFSSRTTKLHCPAAILQ